MTSTDWSNVLRCSLEREIEARFYFDDATARREYFAQRRLSELRQTLLMRDALAARMAGDCVPVY